MRIDIVALNREIADCERTQSWAPSSTRSSWWPALESIRDATDEVALAAAIEYADTEAVRLATIVATRLATDADGLRDTLSEEVWGREEELGVDTVDAWHTSLREASTVRELVAIALRHGIMIDESHHGARDGIVIDHDKGRYYAYATIRDWQGHDNAGTIEVPLGGER